MSSTVLSKNLRALMDASAGLGTQAALAKATGLQQRTIGRVLNSEHSPTLDVIVSIADAFGIQPWQMLVPALDPKNLPVCEFTQGEIDLYSRLRKLVATSLPSPD